MESFRILHFQMAFSLKDLPNLVKKEDKKEEF